jgi:hypothetical protein
LAITLGVAVATSVLAHTVLAEHPPASRPGHSHDHGAMHEVVLCSVVTQTAVPNGLAMDVTGTGRTEQAIRAMVVQHAIELDRMAGWSARTETIPGGVRLTVVADKAEDTKLIVRIRGLASPVGGGLDVSRMRERRRGPVPRTDFFRQPGPLSCLRSARAVSIVWEAIGGTSSAPSDSDRLLPAVG